MEQRPSDAFAAIPSQGCDAHLAEHTTQPRPPGARCEPPPVPRNKLLLVAPPLDGGLRSCGGCLLRSFPSQYPTCNCSPQVHL